MQLEEADEETGLYFKDFSPDMRLRKIIVGANSTISRARVSEALGERGGNVEIFKGRAAFRTFEIVRDLSWPRTA